MTPPGAPKMLSVGLPQQTIGRPGRIRGLEQLLPPVARQPGSWITRRMAIARHWRARMGIAD